MARKNVNIFLRDGVYYARWHEHTEISGKAIVPAKKYRLSLDTADYEVALVRYPVVRLHKISWAEYTRIRELHALKQHWPALEISQVDTALLPYPKPISIVSNDSLEGMIQRAVETGKPTTIRLTDGKGFIIQPMIDGLENNLSAIKDFFSKDVTTLFLDKVQTERNIKIWLQFVDEKGVKSWTEIDEGLMNEFYSWRIDTPQKPEIWGKREATKPSIRTVNRHLKFLQKCFLLAVKKKLMQSNPLDLWKWRGHQAPRQQALTKKELIDVLSDKILDQNYLTNGTTRVKLGYTLRDVILLLYCSCKRRKEVVNLKISDINYDGHFVHYVETKNSSKGTAYNIHKAFHLTEHSSSFVKRLTHGRKEGLVFPSPWNQDEGINPEKISLVFSQVVKRVVPGKDISLNNLRHTCTSIMEQAGLSFDEIDAALGHFQTRTAIKNYLDHSDEVIARRLAKMTEPGIKVLCEIVKDFLK